MKLLGLAFILIIGLTASHGDNMAQGCITVEKMVNDLRMWGFDRARVLRVIPKGELKEAAMVFKAPAGIVFDGITTIELDPDAYVVALMHKGCMANYTIWNTSGEMIDGTSTNKRNSNKPARHGGDWVYNSDSPQVVK